MLPSAKSRYLAFGATLHLKLKAAICDVVHYVVGVGTYSLYLFGDLVLCPSEAQTLHIAASTKLRNV